MDPEALVFDLDGLLIDTEPVWQEVECRVFGAVGVPLTPEMCGQTIGLRIDEVVRYWHDRYPWTGTSLDRVLADVLDGMAAAIAERGAPKPGALAAVRLGQDLGIPLAVASSSPERLIDAALTRLGVADAFAVTASAEREATGKPDPAVFLTAARKLGADPRRSVALEDSPAGVRAAKAAGMRCIAVPSPGHEAAIAPLADVVLDSLEDLTLAHLR
jgi:mannitol-1-/sugar-/sorbitol-6-/2-deoxyglucose-6-phosphatase